MDNGNKECTNIPMPNIIVEKIKQRIKNTEFASVSEYIVFILREVLEDNKDKAALSEEEEAQVKMTLKKLGYLKDE